MEDFQASQNLFLFQEAEFRLLSILNTSYLRGIYMKDTSAAT